MDNPKHYIIVSTSGGLYITFAKNGKLITTSNSKDANAFKKQAKAMHVLARLPNSIRKQAAGWKIAELESEIVSKSVSVIHKKSEQPKSITEDFSATDDFVELCNRTEEFETLYNLLSNVYSNRSKYIDLISLYDKQVSDVLHKVELDSFNACAGFKISKQLQIILRKRRTAKNALKFVDDVHGHTDINIVLSEIRGIQNQKYLPRALPELFGE